jgi:integrase
LPLKLSPPDPKHPTWRVRGKYLGVKVERSTGAREKSIAQKLLTKWKEEIERGCYGRPEDPTFASAALSYMQAGGEATYLTPLIEHFGVKLLAQITQADVDAAAVTIYPGETPATRNRQIYTPVSAVMHHSGVPYVVTADGGHKQIKRPHGAKGESRLSWLSRDQAFALIAAGRARAMRIEQEADARIAAATPRTRAMIQRAAVDAAKAAHRFTALCVFLLYTGARLSEALRVRPQDVELAHSFCYCGKTKNGKPRPVHLPPLLVAELANIEFGRDRVFGVSAKCGRLYRWLDEIATAAGVLIPPRVAFHLFRHTYGAWMRRYCGLDTSGLVATGAWRSRQAAAVYEHVETTEEARKADGLPTPDLGGNWEKQPRKAKT